MNKDPFYLYPDTLVSAAETGQENVPVAPLPNAGEGGPVYDGSSDENNAAGEPVIPLPNPGEGGPVYEAPAGAGQTGMETGEEISVPTTIRLYSDPFSRPSALRSPWFRESASPVTTAP